MANINIKKNRSKKKLNSVYPIVVVSRSNKNISAQLLEPLTKKSLFGFTSSVLKSGSKTEKSVQIGNMLATKIKEMKFDKVIVDRNGLLYHGRVKFLIEAIRSANVEI